MRKNLLGCHVSMSSPDYLLGSALEAVEHGANTFMVYLGAPQNSKRVNWNNLNIDEFKKTILKNEIKIENIIVHAPYIVNVASSNKEKKEFARNFLISEIETMNKIGFSLLVLHPGNFLNENREQAMNNAIDSLNFIIKNTTNIVVCLEYMSGKGTEICTNFDEIKKMISGIVDKKRIGVCLDTCHMSDSGVNVSDIDAILSEFEQKIGFQFLKVFHINDSMNEIGSKKDRHQNIGYGKIGLENLKKWVQHKRLVSIPKILETPYVNGKPPYKEEIIILLKE